MSLTTFLDMVSEISPHCPDGVGRTDVGAGRHGGHIGGNGNHDAGRGGPGPRGGHVDHHGNPAGHHLHFDVAHGIRQSARCIQTNDKAPGVFGLCLPNARLDEGRHPGTDGIRHRHHVIDPAFLAVGDADAGQDDKEHPCDANLSGHGGTPA